MTFENAAGADSLVVAHTHHDYANSVEDALVRDYNHVATSIFGGNQRFRSSFEQALRLAAVFWITGDGQCGCDTNQFA